MLLIHPGDPTIKQDFQIDQIEHANISPLDTFLDVVRNMFPENVIQAAFRRVQTVYIPRKDKMYNSTTISNQSARAFRKEIKHVGGLNILGIIVFSTGFGIIVSQLQSKAKIIVEFFIIFEAVIMKLVEILMW